MKSLTTLLVCLFLLTGLSAQTEVPIVPPNTNAASGTGQTIAVYVDGQSVTIVVTSPQNLASITGVSVNGMGVKWTPPVIDPRSSTKEVTITLTLEKDTPKGSNIVVTGTTVAAGPNPTTLTVTDVTP